MPGGARIVLLFGGTSLGFAKMHSILNPPITQSLFYVLTWTILVCAPAARATAQQELVVALEAKGGVIRRAEDGTVDGVSLVGLKIIDEDLKHLTHLPGIRQLTLNSCTEITDQGLKNIAGLSELERLNLEFCYKISSDGLFIEGPGFVAIRDLDAWLGNDDQ